MNGLLLALALSPSWAAFDSGSVATDSAVFLKMPAGARAAAMGEAQAAAVEDATAVSWNPAALVRVERRSLVLFHSEHIADTAFDYAAYAHRIDSSNVVGFGFRHFSAGRIAQTDATGTEVGAFTPRDFAFSAAFARAMPYGIAMGLGAKLIRSTILATAQTGAVDLGLWAPVPKFTGLSLGLAVTDLGGKLRYESASERLPAVIRVGAAWRAEDWSLSADGVFPHDNEPHAALGAERKTRLWADWSGAFRAGLNTRAIGDIDGFVGPSFGLGIERRRAGVDYAFVPLGGVGTSHLVSLRVAF